MNIRIVEMDATAIYVCPECGYAWGCRFGQEQMFYCENCMFTNDCYAQTVDEAEPVEALCPECFIKAGMSIS